MARLVLSAVFVAAGILFVIADWREDPVLGGIGTLLLAAGLLVVAVQSDAASLRAHPVRSAWIAALFACTIVVCLRGADMYDDPVARGLVIAIFGLLLLGWLERLADNWCSWPAAVLWVLLIGAALSSGAVMPAWPGIVVAVGLGAFAWWSWPGYYYGDVKRPKSRLRRPWRAGRRGRVSGAG